MSRVAKMPVAIPSGVEVRLDSESITVQGAKGRLAVAISPQVDVSRDDGALTFAPKGGREARALAGTTRSLVRNMVLGVSKGFEKRLQIQGVGYRAQTQGRCLNLQLGFSHPVSYELPTGIEVEAVSQTELVVRGVDKQLVGQVCAEIRGFRPPEPYKGKGVRCDGERVRRKEGKKK